MTADVVGGVWTYAVDLCRALSERGVTITLVTMGRPMSADQRADAAGLASVELIETRFPLEWMDDPWEGVAAAGKLLLQLERERRPDVVHLNQFAFGALPFRAPTLVVGHSCVQTWWRAVKGTSAGDEWARYTEVVREGMHGADAFVAPTAVMLTMFETVYGERADTKAIHNGRDGTLFYSPCRSSLEKGAAEPTNGESLYILAAGRLWDEAKNIALLERAAPLLDWPVRVAGEDGGDERLNVRPLGRLTPADLARQMQGAAIYCLPARYEPFGLSALEAAFAGCPLVLGDLPTLREVWGDAAVYVDPDDAEALAITLNTLARDPHRRRPLADAATLRARRYTPAPMAEAYLATYRRLMSASPR